IFRQLIHKQNKNDKAVKSRKCSLLKKKINSFKYFTNKGIMCLNMANKFHEWNRKSRTMFGLIMKNMDNYTKLRKEYEMIKYNMAQLAERERIYDDSFLIFDNNNILFNNGVANENGNNIFEYEDFEIVEFYGRINKVDDRELLLIGIETKLYEIQDTFFKRCFSLYQELNDYGTELRQYLCNDKHTLKSYKYRKKNLGKFVCCRYHLLKRMLERINKHKKRIAKYNPTYKENKWN
ncbi:uncharacterized protein LOC114934921, partial [Nylanderia fulva]|uniref:uncharacterized protein LOC114934921 n=1 Tax=Nylanderia fulva TaxID=613905 RepID=UPI0010FADE74